MNSNALLKAGFNSADQVRRSIVLSIRKMSTGRKGLPSYAVQAMYEDYRRLRSLSKTAKLYNRTRQSMFDLFKTRGLSRETRNRLDRVTWDGRSFTPGKNGYLRETKGGRRPLHKLIWERLHGPIPTGHQVSFRDGNNRNIAIENLVCLPIAEVTLLHYRRNYPERANWTKEQLRQFHLDYGRKYMQRRAEKFKARGLRSDGKRFVPKAERMHFRYIPPANFPKPEAQKPEKRTHSLTALERLALI